MPIRDAEAEEMAHDVCTREDLRIMFRNAQGLATELLDLGKLIETEEADIVGVMETCMLAREDLSQGKTKWLPGPDRCFTPLAEVLKGAWVLCEYEETSWGKCGLEGHLLVLRVGPWQAGPETFGRLHQPYTWLD